MHAHMDGQMQSRTGMMTENVTESLKALEMHANVDLLLERRLPKRDTECPYEDTRCEQRDLTEFPIRIQAIEVRENIYRVGLTRQVH